MEEFEIETFSWCACADVQWNLSFDGCPLNNYISEAVLLLNCSLKATSGKSLSTVLSN